MPFLATFFDYARTAVVFLLMISALVAAHEYGHYLFARIFKMAVEEFSIGFGNPAVWVYARRTRQLGPDLEQTTDYCIRPLPLGGYVRIKGMMPEEDGSEVDIPGGFYSKPAWQRFIVLLAGPVFSVGAGVLILFLGYWLTPQATNSTTIDGLDAKMPAVEGGLKIGDRIVALDAQPVRRFEDIRAYIMNHQDRIKVTFDRGKTEQSVVLQLRVDPTGIAKYPRLGINKWKPGPMERVSAGEAMAMAGTAPVIVGTGLFQVFTHQVPLEDSVGGPVMMVGATHQAVEKGVSRVTELAGLLSVSLGFMNLLPVGIFDGGQMLIALVEMFRRRRVSFRSQIGWFGVGWVVIGCLIVTVLFFDTKRVITDSRATPAPHTAPTK